MKDALEYFRANLAEMISKYEGEYVAIIEDKIIAHGKDVKKVYQEAKDKFPKNTIFLGQVPRKEALIL
jgi:disulfide oxidoreductase YuzD